MADQKISELTLGTPAENDIIPYTDLAAGVTKKATKASLSGLSGFSGISGYSGFSGFSGISGFSGYSGFSGISGFSGYSGLSGFSGISGYSGFSGAIGSQGIQGISGFSGYSGFSGSGISGFSGYSGFSGPAGTGVVAKGVWSAVTTYDLNDLVTYNSKIWISLQDNNLNNTPSEGAFWSLFAEQGVSGYSGYSGYSGFSGIDGASGISGYSGYSGFSGINGASGTSGYSGYSGFSGISGFSGYSGISGYSGFSGQLPSLVPTLDDQTIAGIKDTLTLGETILFGEVGYIDSNSKVLKAVGTSGFASIARVMVGASGNSGNSVSCLHEGYARNDAGWNWTPGGTVYISNTSGAMSQTALSGAGQLVQPLGYAHTADIIYFKPSANKIIHT